MHPSTIELMREQVKIIYRAVTGADLNETVDARTDERTDERQSSLPLDIDVERNFAELDALARLDPAVGERVPPFSFVPLVDVIDAGSEVIVEIVAPGVEPQDVEIQVSGNALTITGVRRGEPLSNGRAYVHAEIPRGPFRRTVQLPFAVDPQPDLDARRGELLLRLKKQKQ